MAEPADSGAKNLGRRTAGRFGTFRKKARGEGLLKVNGQIARRGGRGADRHVHHARRMQAETYKKYVHETISAKVPPLIRSTG